jgi:hypothetical protein
VAFTSEPVRVVKRENCSRGTESSKARRAASSEPAFIQRWSGGSPKGHGRLADGQVFSDDGQNYVVTDSFGEQFREHSVLPSPGLPRAEAGGVFVALGIGHSGGSEIRFAGMSGGYFSPRVPTRPLSERQLSSRSSPVPTPTRTTSGVRASHLTSVIWRGLLTRRAPDE